MWLLRLIGIVVVLVLVAAIGLLLLPGERIAAIAADQVRAQTGRELRIEGGVQVSFWPVLGARTGPVTLGNAAWAGPEPMLRAESLVIGISAPDLLRGAIRVQEIVAQGPDLRLVRGADGRGNWEFSASAPGAGSGAGAAGGGGSVPMTLEALSLTDARLSYAEAGAAPMVLELAAFDLRWPDPDGPVELRAVLAPYEAPVELTAQIRQPAALAAGAAVPVAAGLDLPGGTVRFDGRANLAGEAEGRVTVEAGDSARMLAALGQPGVAIPQGLGRSATVSTTATYTADGKLALRDLALRLDGNRLTGAADLAPGTPPRVTARLAAGVLDLSAAGGGGGAAPGNAASEGWSRAPIDASALGLVDGSLRLTAERIVSPVTELSGVDAHLQIDRSRAVLTLQPLGVFGGTVQGEAVANNRGGLSVAARLRAEAVEMQALLERLAGIDRLSGKAAGEVEILGVGASVDAIMRSLQGKGGLRMGRGVIAGIDLDRLLRSGGGIGGTTVFDSLSASFTIAAGDLSNDDLVLQLSRLTADGKGRIGLGARDIDYLFTPVRLTDADGRQLAVSARIVGPWSGPKIRPELNEALQQELDARRDELERKAKDKAREKLQEELGVTVGEGQSVEDALKDKLEEEAKKGLLRLLGSD